jgi:DNA-binding NtrC family response regulator
MKQKAGPQICWSAGELRVLIVDDERDVRLGLQLLAESLETEVRSAASGEEAVEICKEWVPHLVLSDINMGGMSGVELLFVLGKQCPDTRVVLITGFGTIELAVEAMRRGAANFITKPFDNDDILEAIQRYGKEALLRERTLARGESTDGQDPLIIAEDPRMKSVLELVRHVAPTTMPVLIQGESGSGKELIAQAIHAASNAKEAPFLGVNSAALPDTLLESELFGYKKGAFTGADKDRDGIFSQARGGTVFLDEIALMSPAFQGKLLRVLQEKTVVPLGSAAAVPVDFRLVAATSRNLAERIETGDFREDLYYRLRVVTIDIPPLRERPLDIIPLAEHFLTKHACQVETANGWGGQLSDGAIEELRNHNWRGNVRELENSIQRSLVLAGGNHILAGHLGLGDGDASWATAVSDGLPYEESKQEALRHFKRRFIEGALMRTGGNVTHAADRCGLTRAAFQRIMRSLDVDRNQFTPR